MTSQIKTGTSIGALFALFMVLGEPFYPSYGLIPELVKFFNAVPLWLSVLIFGTAVTPLGQAATMLVYFLLVGALIGAAFRQKLLWGWLLVVMLTINHYAVADRTSLRMGEVVQAILNYFR